MPKLSERQLILKTLQRKIEAKLLSSSSESSSSDITSVTDIIEDEGDLSTDSDSSTSSLGDDLITYELVNSQRYLSERDTVPKSQHWISHVLPLLNENRFRNELRTTRVGFNLILQIIEDDAIFQTKSNSKQLELYLQLHITLYRLGTFGNGASVIKVAAHFGVSEGVILKSTKRVIQALQNKKNEFIKWPNAWERKKKAKELELKSGFANCVGFLDGTDIVVFSKPGF